jgi:hypothetical protein
MAAIARLLGARNPGAENLLQVENRFVTSELRLELGGSVT